MLRSLCSCGVSVPGLRFVDVANGVLGIEWVDGKSVRLLLGSGGEDEGAEGDEDVVEDPLISMGCQKVRFLMTCTFGRQFSYGMRIEILMMVVGTEIAKMHLADIIHGDLTTSNMMLRHPSSILDSLQGTQQLVSEYASFL
jgi:TP53 regulating kinase-like protein